MKNKWLGVIVFVAMIAGFGSCYRPYGYHHGYSDYYAYGRAYYGHGEYLRRDRGRARYRLVRPDCEIRPLLVEGPHGQETDRKGPEIGTAGDGRRGPCNYLSCFGTSKRP